MQTIFLIIMMTIMGPCNKIKSTFEADLNQYFVNVHEQPGILNASDIAHLPGPVQRHFYYCGYVGHEQITNAQAALRLKYPNQVAINLQKAALSEK